MNDTFIDRFEMNDANVQALLKSGAVEAALMSLGLPIKARAEAGGGKYNIRVVHWPARNAVQVGTGDRAAMEAEATNRSLTRAIGGG